MNLLRKAVRFARAAKRSRQFKRIYERFGPFTMIPEPGYVANLEIVEMAKQVAGAVVECGTWKGGMVAGIAQSFGPDREYFLFDSFEGLPPAKEVDGESAIQWQRDTKGAHYYDNCTASETDAKQAMSLAGISNPHLFKGWFQDTLPGKSFPGGIAILRMDADWYESTMQILENLFRFVNRDGIIIVDDYYAWDGCSKALHDFLSREKCSERIHCHGGVCYLRRMEPAAATEVSR